MRCRYSLFGVFCACATVATSAVAQRPNLGVAELGINAAGNREWLVAVTPSASVPPTPLAVELAFSLTGSQFVNIDVNEAVWVSPNPGNNPFTGTVTTGLWLGPLGSSAFGAFGSTIVQNGQMVELFRMETLGLGATTLNWGELGSPDPAKGDIIATIDGNFRDFSGSRTAVEPPPPAPGVVVYDSITGDTNTGGVAVGVYPVGQSVLLAGGQRHVTQFEAQFGSGGPSTFVVEFHELSPANGKPDRLIWQSPVQNYPYTAPFYNNKVVSVDVPGIEVPERFAWTIRGITPENNVLSASNAQTVGIGLNSWLFNPLLNLWVAEENHWGARITAVPEPSTQATAFVFGILVLLGGMGRCHERIDVASRAMLRREESVAIHPVRALVHPHY
jgi:hypothetical protein